MVSDIEWATFFPSAVLLAATPGANQLLILRNGLRHGPRPAISASTGRFAAFALMVVAVAAGLGAVLTASEVAFNAIKWCGVAYLLWLGGRTMLTAARKDPAQGQKTTGAQQAPAEDTQDRGADLASWRLARQEFIVAASNPKAVILFTVFLPQFLVNGAEDVTIPLLVLGAAYIGVEFCCACGYAALGGRLRSMGLTQRIRRLLDAMTGAAMLGLAGWLAAENQ
ncbi:LysE family translocator [Streptomyces rugosispiralis]|uniref:LysE family translocator n=1 Tax=Streptomyces rugosispiralis TaxID=2967341 RepID=A0ABT1V5J5_9ACTN|nr:LysE family translocator [Streptomyces rugosispiralis]MCQ8192654.1 LysE family translocator [Streptomyces rugosispiralis]